MSRRSPKGRSAIAAGTGALLSGVVVYMLLAGFGGGVRWSERWSFDQRGRLELEGAVLLFGLVVAIVVAAPLGAAAGVRLSGGRRPWLTSLLTGILASLFCLLIFRIIPSAPSDPVIAPYLVWGSVFLAGGGGHLIATRGLYREVM